MVYELILNKVATKSKEEADYSFFAHQSTKPQDHISGFVIPNGQLLATSTKFHIYLPPLPGVNSVSDVRFAWFSQAPVVSFPVFLSHKTVSNYTEVMGFYLKISRYFDLDLCLKYT